MAEYARIIVHVEQPIPGARPIFTYQWEGSPLARVIVSHEYIAVGDDTFFKTFKLVLVKEGFGENEYIRGDVGWGIPARAVRVWDRVGREAYRTKARIALTLAVWGLANAHEGYTYSWLDVPLVRRIYEVAKRLVQSGQDRH